MPEYYRFLDHFTKTTLNNFNKKTWTHNCFSRGIGIPQTKQNKSMHTLSMHEHSAFSLVCFLKIADFRERRSANVMSESKCYFNIYPYIFFFIRQLFFNYHYHHPLYPFFLSVYHLNCQETACGFLCVLLFPYRFGKYPQSLH